MIFDTLSSVLNTTLFLVLNYTIIKNYGAETGEDVKINVKK